MKVKRKTPNFYEEDSYIREKISGVSDKEQELLDEKRKISDTYHAGILHKMINHPTPGGPNENKSAGEDNEDDTPDDDRSQPNG